MKLREGWLPSLLRVGNCVCWWPDVTDDAIQLLIVLSLYLQLHTNHSDPRPDGSHDQSHLQHDSGLASNNGDLARWSFSNGYISKSVIHWINIRTRYGNNKVQNNPMVNDNSDDTYFNNSNLTGLTVSWEWRQCCGIVCSYRLSSAAQAREIFRFRDSGLGLLGTLGPGPCPGCVTTTNPPHHDVDT